MSSRTSKPSRAGRGKHKIVIGKDTRLSGYMLENAISSGILSMGVDVLFIGPLPTPGVAYVTRSLRADAGIVITASHNPYDDNGIKFFRADGYKLDDKIEDEIEGLVFSGEIENIRPTAGEIGKAVRIDDALGRYIEFAKASFPRGTDAGRAAHRRGLRARRGLQIHALRPARTGRGSHRLWQPARRHEHQPGLRLDAPGESVPQGRRAQGAPRHRARWRRRPRAALRRKRQVDRRRRHHGHCRAGHAGAKDARGKNAGRPR